MGFLDRFKRKKAVLVHEEKDVTSRPLPEQQIRVSVQPSRPSISPVRKIISQGKALNTIKKKRAIKKRRVMKIKSQPRRRKPAKPSPQYHSKKSEEEPTGRKWLQKDKELLGGALKDLNKELQALRSARKRLELKMANYSSELGDTQDKEISLRNKISDLMKKEAAITKKKAAAKDKIAMMDQKIEKVKTIQTELKSI